MKKIKFYAFILIFGILNVTNVKSQVVTQTIRGQAIDNDSKQPLIGATVSVLIEPKNLITSTDENGKFKLANVPLGRQTIKVTYLGYEPLTMPDIMVTAGKEVILELRLTEALKKMNDIVISYDRKKDRTVTNNEMATVSSRSFNPDDTKKFAGALGDPSRMAANFAGVVAGNDSRNDIVVRGNSPNAMLWQLEGVNIPNPNHFGSNFGTGGPVSMLNNNNIGKSDFFTSAFPAQYGNANGGVFDLVLREGNNEKREFVGQVGFNGLEIGAEGPFSKKSKASYIFNYRYSTLGLMRLIGVNVGTGAATPLYQDMNFKVAIPTKGKGKVTFFGMGGISSIDLLAKDVDTTGIDFYGDVNQNQWPRFAKAIVGSAFEKSLSSKTWAKFTMALSHTNDYYDADSINLLNNIPYRRGKGSFIDNKYSAVFNLTHKFNAKNTLNAGITNDLTMFDYSNIDYFNEGKIDSIRVKQNGSTNLTQAYLQLKHRFNERITLSAGIHSQYFDINNQFVVEPRLGLRYAVSEKSSINFGYGMHNQTLPTYNLFVKNDLGQENNKKLDFIRSNHLVMGYETMLSSKIKFKTEVYYQYLDKVPVNTFSSSFSALNLGSAFNPSNESYLTNGGTGYNYGIELTIEKYFSKGFYYLITGSVFDSKYKGSDGIERNTSFNTNYAANMLAGKEFNLGKKGHVLYANIKLTTIGGRYFTPINFEASKLSGEAVYDNNRAFSSKQDAYFRMDIKIGYRKDYKKSSLEFAFDLQNVTNHQNIFSQGYNRSRNTISNEYQQGFFPVPMFRFTF